MSKLENKSSNLKEILCAIADGKQVQYWYDPDRKWQTLHNVAFGFAIDEDGIKLKWRIKPDAFEEVWECYKRNKRILTDTKSIARYFFNSAMEHKGDE